MAENAKDKDNTAGQGQDAGNQDAKSSDAKSPDVGHAEKNDMGGVDGAKASSGSDANNASVSRSKDASGSHSGDASSDMGTADGQSVSAHQDADASVGRVGGKRGGKASELMKDADDVEASNGDASSASQSGSVGKSTSEQESSTSKSGGKGGMGLKGDKSNASAMGRATNPDGTGDGSPEEGSVDGGQSAMDRHAKVRRAVQAGKAGGKAGVGAAAANQFMRLMRFMSTMLANAVNAGASFLGGILGAIGNFFTTIGTAIASALGVGMTVATVVAGGMIGLLVIGVIAGVATLAMNGSSGAYNTEVEDCSKNVLTYGTGDGTIPEKLGNLTIGYTTTWEADIGWLDSHISSGTAQRTVVDMCKAGGSVHDSGGFLKIGDYYIVAIAPTPFGTTEDVDAHVGDYITFYLSDGTALECIVGDTKGDVKGNRRGGGTYDFRNGTSWDEIVPIDTPTGPAQISAYGHTYGNDVNVLEFWGTVSENNHFEKITGKKGLRVASFTNHGPAKEYSDYVSSHGGSLQSADVSKTTASASARGKSKDNCVKSKSYDNSSLAAAAVSYAYPTASEATGNNGTSLYQKLHEAIFPGDPYFMSCDRCVATAVRWSGYDDDYPPGACTQQYNYCVSSDRWKEIGTDKTLTVDDLEPGDIFIMPGAHTFMYVGTEIIQQKYVGKADASANSVSGSFGQRSAGCDSSTTWALGGGDSRGTYHVFRCVNPMHSDKYAHAGD